MNRLITISLLLWCTVTLISAQNVDEMRSSSPEDRAANQTEWMKTELSLDSATEHIVYNVNLRYAKANQVIFDSGERKIIKLKKIKGNQIDKDKQLKSILSKEQYDKYLIMKEKIRQNRNGKLKKNR